MFDPVLHQLPLFAGFLLTALALLGAFCLVYVAVTPYNELALIRAGNEAAAISLGGAVIGFALPIAVSVAVSHNLYAMLGWGLVAGLVQIAAFVAARLALPQLSRSIPEGRRASGLFLAALSLAVGILNAGCLI